MPLTLRADLYSEGDTLATVEQADAFHTLRGNAEWLAASLESKESALVAADDYIATRYMPCDDIEGIPADVVKAVSFLAATALSSSLATDPATGESSGSGVVTSRTQRVGTLQQSVTFDVSGSSQSSTRGGFKSFPLVEGWLAATHKLGESAGGFRTVFSERH